jgi:beta-xylosidase
MMYHGYENGYWTLGRQALLEPVEWAEDGWPRPLGGDLSRPIKKPVEVGAQQHGMALSDDFQTDRMGTAWAFYDPAPNEMSRLQRVDGTLYMAAKGTTPSDCAPLCCIAGDQAYRVTVDIDADEGTEAGLLLFYNRRLYAGLGFGNGALMMHRYGLQRSRGAHSAQDNSGKLSIRLTNDRNILTIHTSNEGRLTWRKFDVQMEVSGYHHNVAYDFLSLRPALYAAGQGQARFRNFTYEAL